MLTRNALKVLVATLVGTASLFGCSTPPGPGGQVASGQPAVGSEPHAPATVGRLFSSADSNHDGRLTREEARSRLPLTYSSFDSIDVDRRGWITLDQFAAFTTERTDKLADDILHLGDRM